MPEATLWVIFTTAFLIGLSGALLPGPLLTVAISESARQGFWTGPLLVLGHGIAELILVIALARGLAQFLDNRNITSAIGVLGGLFLLWMAYSIMGRALNKTTSLMAHPPPGRLHPHPSLSGILLSVFNPAWLVWWATVGVAYVLWSLQAGTAGLLFFYSGHIISDLSWYTMVALLVATGKKLVTDTIFRGVLLACGLFLVGLSGFFIMNGVRFWIGGG